MIYLFYGPDFRKARERFGTFLLNARAENPNALCTLFDDLSYSSERVHELAVSQGLFDGESIVALDHVLGIEEAERFVCENVEALQKSKTLFVFLEEEVSKTLVNLFETHAEKCFFHDTKTKKENSFMTSFGLTDALGKRDKKNAWILLQNALQKGDVPEKIHGLVFWQIKTLCLVKNAVLKGDTALRSVGLAPFVLKKSLSFCKNYSCEELKHFSAYLVKMYHEAHRGGPEIGVALERWILSL